MAYYEGEVSGLNTNGNGNNNGGFFGNEGLWAVIILAIIFGWGNNGFGFGGNGGGTPTTTNVDASLQRDFDTASIQGKLDAITTNQLTGFSNLQNQVCNCCGDINNAISTNGYETRLAINDLGYRQQDCCCKTQNLITSGFADVNYNLATQVCDLKNTMNSNTRDIIDSQRNGVGQILDYLTNEKINSLTVELAQAQGQLSQANQTNNIINALRNPAPIPAYVVANPSCCQTSGCACGSVV